MLRSLLAALLLLLVEDVFLNHELLVDQALVALAVVPRNQEFVQDEVSLG